MASLWLGWSMVGSGEAVRGAAQRSIRTAEYRSRIALLDQRLTDATRIGVLTGEARWTDRHEADVQALDAVIAEAITIADAENRPSLVSTVLEANHDLRVMERRALTLAAGADRNEALALLDGPEFSYLQDVYEAGMQVFAREVRGDADAHVRWVNDQIWIRAAGFGGCVVLLAIILMTVSNRARVQTAAATDALTRLLNRRQFRNDLAALLARPGLSAQRRALVIVGLDRFKAVNDAVGHATADALLQDMAASLRRLVPSGVPVARIGGDEFALVVTPDCDTALIEQEIRSTVTTLTAAAGSKYGRQIALTASAGVTWMPGEATEAGEVMRRAEVALRQAKADGGGRVRLFDGALEASSRARLLLETDLRLAIEADAIVPFFQPLIDLQSGRPMGVEVLARWQHATRGWVSPADFIPLTESLGLIDALTVRLLRRACRAALAWPEPLTIAFNVSPLQLRDETLPGLIRRVLAETGFPAHRLELEVTEGALVSDLDLARRLLEDLRRDGIKLALDDFGTGFSSLKHLRSLPFDTLKIDASFVRGMVDDEESRKIVAAVVGLGHSLGLSTVAEGVETARVADLLRDLGCDIGQGWLFGRPVPASDFGLVSLDPTSSLVA